MESLIHADIFFFISSIIGIILGILLAIIFVYLIKILIDIREISRIARTESQNVAEDVRNIRHEVHSELVRGKSVIGSLFKVGHGLFRRRKL